MIYDFRIWWITPKIMIPWEDVREKFNMTIFDSEWDKDRVIMQYTNFIDNAGKKVYDGDIIECTEAFCGDSCQPAMEYMVTWIDGGWECIPKNTPQGSSYFSLNIFDAINNYGAEVVSNIYED